MEGLSQVKRLERAGGKGSCRGASEAGEETGIEGPSKVLGRGVVPVHRLSKRVRTGHQT